MSKIDDKHLPIINYHISKFTGGDVPEAVLRSKAKIIYADTVSSYDPSKGTFESYLGKNLMGLNRFVSGSMQIRMPEHKQQKTRQVMDTIHDEYEGEAPIEFERMGKLLNMSPKAIKSIYAGATRGIVADQRVEDYVNVGGHGMPGVYDSATLYASLPSQAHKDVFDYSMGEHGKPPLKTNAQIGARLGISESYVRKLKEHILTALKEQ